MAAYELIASTTIDNNTTHSVTFSGISSSDDYQQYELFASCRNYDTDNNPTQVEFWIEMGTTSGYTYGGIVFDGTTANLASPWRNGGYGQAGFTNYSMPASYWNVTAIGGDWAKGKAAARVLLSQVQRGGATRKAGQGRMTSSMPRSDSANTGHLSSHFGYVNYITDLTSFTVHCSTPATTTAYFADNDSFMLYGIKNSNAE